MVMKMGVEHSFYHVSPLHTVAQSIESTFTHLVKPSVARCPARPAAPELEGPSQRWTRRAVARWPNSIPQSWDRRSSGIPQKNAGNRVRQLKNCGKEDDEHDEHVNYMSISMDIYGAYYQISCWVNMPKDAGKGRQGPFSSGSRTTPILQARSICRVSSGTKSDLQHIWIKHQYYMCIVYILWLYTYMYTTIW